MSTAQPAGANEPIPSTLLDSLPKTYAISAIVAKRAALREAGVDVIDLSIGEPDLPAAPIAREALAEAAANGDFHRYPSPRGIPALRAAFAEFYERRYGRAIDPDRQVLPLLGTKEGLVHLAQAFSDRDKPVYGSVVSYPVYATAPTVAGARLVRLEGGWDEGYVPRFPADVGAVGGVAFVASPANPTGAVLGEAEVQRLLEECQRRRVVLCFDAAYAEVAGSQKTVLPFARYGASGVVEFHSLSKCLSLAGWRVGFAVGDPAVIGGMARIKSFTDAGMPMPQQLATASLLGKCDELIDLAREHFLRRQRDFRAALAGLPIELYDSDAGMFCWARSDRPAAELAEAFVAEGILPVPGTVFGPGGERCIRMTVCQPPERLPELRARLERIL